MGRRQRPVLLLQLSKEPHVLDGDDGLVGEGLQQGDLSLRERLDLCARHGDGPDGGALAQHRHPNPRAIADDTRTLSRPFGYLRILLHVDGLDDTTVPHHARATCRAVADMSRVGSLQLFARQRPHVVARSKMEHLPIDEEQRAVEAVAECYRASDDRVEYWLGVGG